MASVEYNLETGVVSYDFGKAGKLEIWPDAYPAAIRRQLMFHGLEQKTRDSYAGAKKAVEQGEATDTDTYARDCVESVHEMLSMEKWSDRAGSRGPRLGDIVEALQSARPAKFPDRATALAFVKAADAAKVDALKSALAPQLAAIAEDRARKRRLAAEQAAANKPVDLDSLV